MEQTAKCKVTFSVKVETKYGEEAWVLASCPELGITTF